MVLYIIDTIIILIDIVKNFYSYFSDLYVLFFYLRLPLSLEQICHNHSDVFSSSFIIFCPWDQITFDLDLAFTPPPPLKKNNI